MFYTLKKSSPGEVRFKNSRTIFLVFTNSQRMEERRDCLFTNQKSRMCTEIYEFTSKFSIFTNSRTIFCLFTSRERNRFHEFTNVFFFIFLNSQTKKSLPEHRWGASLRKSVVENGKADFTSQGPKQPCKRFQWHLQAMKYASTGSLRCWQKNKTILLLFSCRHKIQCILSRTTYCANRILLSQSNP